MLFPTVSPPSTFSVASISLLPHRALPKLFPMVSPPVHPIVASVSLLPNGALLPTGALPQAISHGSPPSTLSSFPYRSFPPELSTSYFPRFPFRPPSRRFRIAPSQHSSPQAISHGFPSVHPVITPVSLLPTGTLPKLFPTVSPRPPSRHSRISPSYFPRFPPSTLSSLRYRSFPPELSPYFHGFPSVHPFVASVSLPCDKVTKREPKHRRCFWEKTFYAQTNSPA